MRFLLRFISCLLLGGVLALAGPHAAHASHIQGGQITYRYVSGDTYEVTVSFYRDCSSTLTLEPSVTITAKSTCSAAGVSATLAPVPNSQLVGTGYCPSIQALAVCTSGNPYPNFEKQDYRGTISLPPAANWIISYNSCCRPSTANLVGMDNFQFEATLNNQVTVNGVTTRVNNSSPLFSSRDLAVPFVLVNQRTSLNFTAASEADGDSLVYEMDQPIANCGVSVPYAPQPHYFYGACIPVILPSAPNTACLFGCNLPANSPYRNPNFSVQMPLPVAIDTTGFCGTIAGTVYSRSYVPRFYFNAAIGEFTFTPNLYLSGNPNLGLNKYSMVGKITEYRRLPGSNRRYRVGSVRRDFLVIVIDGAGNQVPGSPVVGVTDPLSGAVAVNRADTTRLTVFTCNYTQARIAFTDPNNTAAIPANPLQNLTVAYTGAGTIGDLLQSGDIGTFALLRNGTPTPELRFYFQPSASFAGQTIRIPLRIEDDACPIKGIQTRIVEIRIRRGSFLGVQAGASGPTIGQATLCLGDAIALNGNVSRPDSVRQLSTNTTIRQTYTYSWTATGTAAQNGLTSAQATQSQISVSPTITTRYSLRVSPVSGFAQGACGDTTSVLVRVVPRPAPPVVSRVGNSLVSSVPNGNQWYRNNAVITGATSQTLALSSAGNYTVTASIGTGPAPTLCTSLPSPAQIVTSARQALAGTSLHIAPNPTPTGLATVELTGYHQATTLTLYDVTGRVVFTATIAAPNAAGTSYPLNISQLPSGVYALRVSTAGGVDVCRVVRE